MKQILPWVIAVLALLLLFYAKGCESPQPHTITIRDTVQKAPVTVTVHDIRTVVKYRDGRTTHDTAIFRMVDSVLVEKGVAGFTACADTTYRGDTLSACYSYPENAVTFSLRFAPVTHDTTITARPIAAWSVYGLADVDAQRQIFIGAGADGSLWGVSVYGTLGVDLQPIAANAHAGVRIKF